MKILFIQPTCDKKGHYGKYTLNLCQELARLGNEVILFTNKAEPTKFLKENPLFKIIEYKGGAFTFDRFDAARKAKPWLYFWGYLRNSFVIFRAALEFAKRFKPDIIQITDVEFGILSLCLALRKGGQTPLSPVVLLVHAANFSFSKYPENIIFRIYKVLQREFLRTRLSRQIKAIVTLGEYHKEELQKQFRLPSNFPIKVIYDGANPPTFYLSTAEARQKLGIEYGGAIFLLFGNLRRDKGIEYLLEAVRILDNPHTKFGVGASKKPAFGADFSGDSNAMRNSGSSTYFNYSKPKYPVKPAVNDGQKTLEVGGVAPPDPWLTSRSPHYVTPRAGLSYQNNSRFKILLVGSPFDYEPKEISDMVMKLGLEDRVILRLGYVPDEEIPFYFFATDCVVFPYRKNYTGGTGPLFKEAAMFKKPVIVSRVSEMGWFVAEKQMGLVAEPENATDLAQKMAEFLSTPEGKRRKWGENAFNAVNTWGKMAKQYVELYQYIVKGHGSQFGLGSL